MLGVGDSECLVSQDGWILGALILPFALQPSQIHRSVHGLQGSNKEQIPPTYNYVSKSIFLQEFTYFCEAAFDEITIS
jgi:hypothetical protein